MNILVTGGAGYIGSHTVVELVERGYGVSIIDNFSNSSRVAIERIASITGKNIPTIEGDVGDQSVLDRVFADKKYDAVIHFAGFKSVGESVVKPLDYYRNNIGSTLALCEAMQAANVKRLVFSSSATVYGSPQELPLNENSPVGVGITNPYGQTKFMIERILEDLAISDPRWQISLLRYFNPVGAHASGLIGEDPNGLPNNLLPFIAQVAIGRLDKVKIFGNDYDTLDGTGVRDYIHVVDLAKGHLAALEHQKQGANAYNLGTGSGVSVLEIIKAFERASGKSINYEVVGRRPGDVGSCYADCSKAAQELDWQATKTLDEACADAWHWQSQNPNGFRS